MMILTFGYLLSQAQTHGVNQIKKAYRQAFFRSCSQVIFGNSLCLPKKPFYILIEYYSGFQENIKLFAPGPLEIPYDRIDKNLTKIIFYKKIISIQWKIFHSRRSFLDLHFHAMKLEAMGQQINRVTKLRHETACCTIDSNQGIKKCYWQAKNCQKLPKLRKSLRFY